MAATAKKIEQSKEFQKDIANLAKKYYDKGYDDGVKDTTDSFKAAVSDGLRCGSSECGKKMQQLKQKK